MTIIKKTYRIDEDIKSKIEELMKIYMAKSENELFGMIVRDIYDLKKSKAIVPIEVAEQKDDELKRLYFELGKLKAELEQKEKELEKEKNKSFWAKLFGK